METDQTHDKADRAMSELFDMDNLKPLKLGTSDDIRRGIVVRRLRTRGGEICATLAGDVRRIRYKKSLAVAGFRYDLNGQLYGEVTSEQQQKTTDTGKKTK